MYQLSVVHPKNDGKAHRLSHFFDAFGRSMYQSLVLPPKYAFNALSIKFLVFVACQ